jgi:tight adherence protein B
VLSLAFAALGAAALSWPVAVGRARLGRPRARWTATTVRPGAQPRAAHRFPIVLMVVAAGGGALLAGPAGALAAALASGTATARWRAGRERRDGAAAAAGLADALAVLVAELRAGAQAGDAAGAAAADGHPDTGRALSAAAAAVRIGGDVPAVLRNASSTMPAVAAQLRPGLGSLAHAWSLADRHGIPLADLLDAVRADTEERVRFAADVQARLAGPRATAAVLAGLPLLGLALGQAVGGAPVRVLGQTGVGQLLLVLGSCLACAGVLWSARLVAGAVRA